MKLILFDIDGTLVITHGAGREATRGAMTEVFGTYGALVGHKFGGKTDWLTLHELLPAAGIAHEEIERRMEAYNVAMGLHLDAIIGQYAVEACPGSLELVAALSQRDDVGLGIVTGNVSSTAPIKLRAAGFDPGMFPVGAYGHEAMERNLLPALAVARAVEHYRYPFTPQEVIVVGDTLADITCARALGAVAVAVATGFEPAEDLQAAEPDYFLNDLTEFGRVFG
ncbi:MAG: HAD hydrolase-like protein [Chloroflexi bacterium]|nr:HAD hydrolase-like protein [Chloroflexota bacterium]